MADPLFTSIAELQKDFESQLLGNLDTLEIGQMSQWEIHHAEEQQQFPETVEEEEVSTATAEPEIIYPWDPRNFPKNIENLVYTEDGGIRDATPKFSPIKEQVYIGQRVDELAEEYGVGQQVPKVVYTQSIPDIVQQGNQEEYFKPFNVPIERCIMSPMQFNEYQDSAFQTYALTGEIAVKNKNLLERVGALNPALGLMLERPAAIVIQSAFIKRLAAVIDYEIKKCECPEPGYNMSWLFEMIRSNNIIDDEEPELIIQNEPDEKMMARFKIYQKAWTSICLHFENLRPILLDIKRNYEAVLALRTKEIQEFLLVKKSIEQYEKLLDSKREQVQTDGYVMLNELQQQIFLLMRHVDRQDSAIRTMTEMLFQIERSLEEERELRIESEEKRKLLIIEVNDLRRKYGLGPAAGVVITAPKPSANNEGTTGTGTGTGTNSNNNPNQNIETTTTTFEVGFGNDLMNSYDTKLLRTTLDQTRKAISEAHHRITILEADYSDVVPMEDYTVVKIEVERLQERNSKTSETFDTLSSQVDGLRNEIENLMSDCVKLNEIMNDLKLRPTPRPSWEKLGEHFTRVVEKENVEDEWNEIYIGRSSNEITQKMVEKLTGKRVYDLNVGHSEELTPEDYITPLGNDQNIPKYLRYNYYVLNRHYSVREAISFTHDIWNARMELLEIYRKVKEAQDEEANGSYGYGIVNTTTTTDKKAPTEQLPDELPIILPFPDYVLHFFKERIHLLHLRMEWIYNIIETCKLHPEELKLYQFLGTLESRFDEAAYHLYRAHVELIKIQLTKKSDEVGTSGALMIDLFKEVLKVNFVNKTEEQLDALCEAASKQTGNYTTTVPIKFLSFFVQTEDGLVGEFVTQVAKQLQNDIKTFVYDILGELLAELGVSLAAAENAENDPAGDTDVSMENFYLALTAVDPTITPEKIGAAMAWVFLGESTLPGQSAKTLPLVDFIKSHLRQKAAMTAGSEGSDEEDDHDDDDFERIVLGIQQRRQSLVNDKDDDEEEKSQIRRLKVANLRTVMRRLKGSALLRHGPRYLPSDSPKDGNSSTEVNKEATAPTEPVADSSTKKKKSVAVVDLYSRKSKAKVETGESRKSKAKLETVEGNLKHDSSKKRKSNVRF